MESLPVVLQHLVYHYEHQLSWHKVIDEIADVYHRHKRCVDVYIYHHWTEIIALQDPKIFFPERHAPGGSLHKSYLNSWWRSVLQAYRVARSVPVSSFIGSI